MDCRDVRRRVGGVLRGGMEDLPSQPGDGHGLGFGVAHRLAGSVDRGGFQIGPVLEPLSLGVCELLAHHFHWSGPRGSCGSHRLPLFRPLRLRFVVPRTLDRRWLVWGGGGGSMVPL